MKCVIIGNCQSIVVGNQIQKISPGTEVKVLFDKQLVNDPARLESSSNVGDFDCVITQVLEGKQWGPLRSSQIAPKARRLEYFPTLHFTGLHPDAVRISRCIGFVSPLGAWQPGIVMAGFLLGLPQSRVIDLYNAYIFDVLGYFAEYDKSVAFHRSEAAKIGYDMDFEMWSKHGQFVWVPNHPAPLATHEISKAICAKLGVARDDTVGPSPDLLQEAIIWPVYPELPRRIGMMGLYTFLLGHRKVREASLDEVVHHCYEAYSKAPEVIRTGVPQAARIAEKFRAEGI